MNVEELLLMVLGIPDLRVELRRIDVEYFSAEIRANGMLYGGNAKTIREALALAIEARNAHIARSL